MNTMFFVPEPALAKAGQLVGCVVQRFVVALVVPAWPLLGWAQQAQQTVPPLPAAAPVQAAPQDLRSAVRLQQISATKNAKQSTATPKMAQNLEAAKKDDRHLTGEERAQLRKQLARELSAQH